MLCQHLPPAESTSTHVGTGRQSEKGWTLKSKAQKGCQPALSSDAVSPTLTITQRAVQDRLALNSVAPALMSLWSGLWEGNEAG